ncbi:MAG: hypothetical protein JWM81_256 [Candidatus Saccharibacteria bacterium]|nr:hypothetical protein [Candidatus Saccharibacteria bacterium]
MNNLAIEKHRQLADFTRHLDTRELWLPETFSDRLDVAHLIGRLDTDEDAHAEQELIVQRFRNAGGLALKINFWESSLTRSYLGAIGFHHTEREPYHKLAASRASEGLLYEMLATAQTL